VIFPHPRPESVFQNYKDFSVQKPRICVRFAVRSGLWKPGEWIDYDHILCASCMTPRDRKRGQCSWNCQRCGICTGRKFWSATCVSCWKQEDGDVMKKSVEWDPAHVVATWNKSLGATPKLLSRSKTEEVKGKTCGFCLGRLDFEPGSNSYS